MGTSHSQPRLWANDVLSLSLERELASLADQESALIFASTLHAAHDILSLLAGRGGAIFLDERAYPISEAGAKAAGASIQRFAHNDPGDLARRLSRCRARERVIVCDGLYMDEGKPAVLADLCKVAEAHDAYVYVDDAQGIGLLGRAPNAKMPYGYGGGGTPAFYSARPGRVIQVATLAKALGVPLAFAAAPAGFIEYLRTTAFSHIHNSPPAPPVVAAALAAVRLNRDEGNDRRSRLFQLVRLLQSGIESGQRSTHNLPMQSIYFDSVDEAATAAASLRRRGIWTVVHFNPPDNPHGGALRLLLTAQHEVGQILRVVDLVNEVIEATGVLF
jgi:8-amino-7-oxononanoate synthase